MSSRSYSELVFQAQPASIRRVCLFHAERSESSHFFARPICVPCTLLPNTKLPLLSAQCAASGLKCSSISVRELFPFGPTPPSEFCSKYVN